MGVVLDANVYLSGIPRLRDQDSPPRKLIAAWLAGEFDVVISDHIIDEVTRNLRKPYFKQVTEGIDAIGIFIEIHQLADVVNVQHLTDLPRVASLPEDDYVVETVIRGRADALITGDKQLLRLGTVGLAPVLSPLEMLDLIYESRSS